jgi:hypothetical protein
MKPNLKDHNIKRQLESSWHWTRFSPTADRPYGAMAKVIAADRWCEEHIAFGCWVRHGDRYFFERQDDLMLFALTWL